MKRDTPPRPDHPVASGPGFPDLPASAWKGLALGWLGFWALMLAVGVQEHLRQGGQTLWRPVVEYGTSALLATAVVRLQLKLGIAHDALLDRPARWFARVLVWMPAIALGYVAAVYALRHALYAAAGRHYRHEPWSEVFLYETAKFAIFFTLFCGIHFGVRSYQAWAAERLRTEHQARLAQEARLLQLTQQLQPHFMFNALNTISALIHTDPDTADTLVTRLATLLRAATDAGQRPQQPLADELALLAAYADIMLKRFADRAEVQWDIDPAARACSVPTLGLQPVLENCFRHVVERRRAPTRIVVRARCMPSGLRVEIEDDGAPRAQAPALGVGLGNLRDRLHALHGARASLALQVCTGGGLRVRIELPCGC